MQIYLIIDLLEDKYVDLLHTSTLQHLQQISTLQQNNNYTYYTESDARRCFVRVLRGIQYLHNK